MEKKDSRVILVVVIIGILGAIVFWGTGKKSEPVDFDTNPFVEDNEVTPVDINHRQVDMVDETSAEADTSTADILPSSAEGMSTDVETSSQEPVTTTLLPEGGEDPGLPTQPEDLKSPPAPVVATTYIVKKGDSLSKIAARELGSASKWKKIFEENKKLLKNNPASLRVGMKLVLPAAGASTPPVEKHPVTVVPTKQDVSESSTIVTYTVKKGDSLYKIATKLYGKPQLWKKILEANKKTLGDKGVKLAVGQLLVIPSLEGAEVHNTPAQAPQVKEKTTEDPDIVPVQPFSPEKTENKIPEIDESIFNFEQKVDVP